jgi:hypothetical protein
MTHSDRQRTSITALRNGLFDHWPEPAPFGNGRILAYARRWDADEAQHAAAFREG